MRNEEQRKTYEGLWLAAGLAIVFLMFSIRHAAGSEPIINWLPEPVPIMLSTQPLHWNYSPTVSVDDSAGHLMPEIRYAVWMINKRTNLGIKFADQGDIVFSVAGFLEVFEVTQSIFTLGYATLRAYPQTGRMHSARITISAQYSAPGAQLTRTIVHELIHALGVNYHVDNPKAVMFPTNNNRISLTYDDLQVLPYGAGCAAEVLPDGSIYIPAIAGHDVAISRDLRIASDFKSDASCSGRVLGDYVLLDSVIGFNGSYRDVLLKHDSGKLTVIYGTPE